MSREQRANIRGLHVFEKQVSLKKADGNKDGNLYNQLKNFKGTFVDPYIVIADFDTKLVHVLERGERKSIFPPFDAELSYIKANPNKGSPLAIVGYDYQEPAKILKVKYYTYNTLNRETPEKRITILSKKGKEIMYDLFHLNDNYTALAMASSKGQAEIRVVCGKNLAIGDPTRDVEIALDTAILKNIFVPVCEIPDVQNLYYTTQSGIYYLDAIDKNKKGFPLTNLSPQFCDLNKNGEIVFINYENSTVHKINPSNRQKDKEIPISETAKKGLILYRDYAVVITASPGVNSTSFDIKIYDITNEYIAYNFNSSNIRAVIPGVNSIYTIMEINNIDKECDLFVIVENEDSLKLEKFFKRNTFDIAYRFAKNNNYDESLLAEISKHHGDHSHLKSDYTDAIKQYIQTIGFLEPSYVIRKFLDVAQIDYLIKYLEELHNHPGRLANQHHTALLLNCFVKQKSIEKLKQWMDRVSTSGARSNDYTETAVKVCMDLDQINLAKDFAQKCKHHELYLRILIENRADAKGNEKEQEDTRKADLLAAIEYIKTSVPLAERAKFVRIFGNSLVKFHPDKILELLKDLITTEILPSNAMNPTPKTDLKYTPDIFFHLFIGNKDEGVLDCYGKYLEFLLQHLNRLPNERQILNAAFEYYLKMIKTYNDVSYRKYRDKPDKEIELIEKKILLMIKDQNIQGKLDKNHVLLLFKIYSFSQGVAEICRLMGLKTELLNYYIEKKDLNEIIKFCNEYGAEDPNLWITALNFICSKPTADEKNDKEKLDLIPKVLEKIVNIENLSHILVLKILMGNDKIQASHIKKYFIQKIKNQQDEIKQELEIINDNVQQIKDVQSKYMRLKTHAQNFQEGRCGTCRTKLSYPTVHFMCGHSFHDNCLESHDCPIHFNDQKNIIDKQTHFTEQKLNPKIFESDLSKAKNKFDVVAEYLGKINLNQ